MAAAAFLAEAHKRAQDDAERKAKRQQPRSPVRGLRPRNMPASSDDDGGALTSDPIASATYTTLTLPDTLFG